MLLFIKHCKNYKSKNHMFQYISCYSLSMCCVYGVVDPCRFNTSHVTLYLFQTVPRSPVSPVSIHLMLLFIAASATEMLISPSVSIHLMLLFIRNQTAHAQMQKGFQYISCYSLSMYPSVSKTSTPVSIRLMLLFIPMVHHP